MKCTATAFREMAKDRYRTHAFSFGEGLHLSYPAFRLVGDRCLSILAKKRFPDAPADTPVAMPKEIKDYLNLKIHGANSIRRKGKFVEDFIHATA